jgi:hypothetical protein
LPGLRRRLAEACAIDGGRTRGMSCSAPQQCSDQQWPQQFRIRNHESPLIPAPTV